MSLRLEQGEITADKAPKEAGGWTTWVSVLVGIQSLDKSSVRRRKTFEDVADQSTSARDIVVGSIRVDDCQSTVLVIENMGHV